MKVIKIFIIFVTCLATLGSCSYNEVPPKTNDASSNYVLPKGEIPTDEEVSMVEAARLEYEESISN